ncbi:MAG TPA: hypothetical protein VGF95_10195 [Solirubrobacteraceae bacterium]|jgi:hypothetical protein
MERVCSAGLSARRAKLRKRVLRFAPVLAVGALCALPGQASAEASPTLPKVTPANTAAPTLTGTPLVGQTLTCASGSWTGNPSYSYTWLRGGVAIAGASADTYTLQGADAGKSIGCEVSATNGGEYTLTGLPSGSYKVGFSSRTYLEEFGLPSLNYLFGYYGGKQSFGEAAAVSVTSPNATPNIDAALMPAGQITGRLTNAEGGGPIAGIEACAEWSSGEECADTNANGEYAIPRLNGEYTVEFYGYACTETACEQRYAEQSYNGGASVTVTAPGTTSNIDAVMVPNSGRISGTVTEAGDKGLANIRACADLGPGDSYSCANTNTKGEYTIANLPEGGYKVAFAREFEGGDYQPQYWNEQSTYAAAEEVVLNGSDKETKTGIDAKLAVGVEIKGKVIDETTKNAIAEIELCAYTPTTDYESCSVSNEKGEYEVPGLAAGVEYTLYAFSSHESDYIDSSNAGKVTAPATAVNIELVRGGQITGRLTAATNGAPIEHAYACIANSSFFYVYACSETNANGEYAITDLDGQYKVEFDGYVCLTEDELYCPHPYQPQYYSGKGTVEEGETLTVAPGQSVTGIDGVLAEGGEIAGRVTSSASGAPLAGVEACAYPAAAEGEELDCALASEVGSATAVSATVAVASPSSHFKLKKKPSFDAKSGDLVFVFEFPEGGALNWMLSFRNSDVAFADDLSVSSGQAHAEIAKQGKSKKGGKDKHCKKGLVKHKGKCVSSTVPFGKGAEKVASGTVTVKAHASPKALKALKSGHTLHVSGAFTFKSALGGAPASLNVKAVVREPQKGKKAKKHKKKG